MFEHLFEPETRSFPVQKYIVSSTHFRVEGRFERVVNDNRFWIDCYQRDSNSRDGIRGFRGSVRGCFGLARYIVIAHAQDSQGSFAGFCPATALFRSSPSLLNMNDARYARDSRSWSSSPRYTPHVERMWWATWMHSWARSTWLDRLI